MKPRFLLGLIVIAVVCGSAWLLIRERYARLQHQQVSPTRDEYGLLPSQPGPGDVTVHDGSSANNGETKTPSPGAEIVPEQTPAVPPAVREAPLVIAQAPAPALPVERQRAKAGAENAPQPLVPKPIARTALGYVGADEDAEEVWVNAINDPNRSADERKDLIEDLNEDGFPDPKHITEDDLPLIVSRLMLIEELAPDAIDDVNAAAFAEAYKDLTNMLARLARN